ncbi:hypothetical protein ACAW74_01925 [Fibrella sp. WM1]
MSYTRAFPPRKPTYLKPTGVGVVSANWQVTQENEVCVGYK